MGAAKTCGQCIYYEPTKTIKNIGTCQVPVPYWVTLEFDAFAFVAAGDKGVASLCQTYTEGQEERNLRSQLDLYKDIVDGYGQG